MAFGNGFYSSKETRLLDQITRMRREVFIRRDREKKKRSRWQVLRELRISPVTVQPLEPSPSPRQPSFGRRIKPPRRR